MQTAKIASFGRKNKLFKGHACGTMKEIMRKVL